MKTFPAALERLSEQFARLPGIGSKTAQRLAFQDRPGDFLVRAGDDGAERLA